MSVSQGNYSNCWLENGPACQRSLFIIVVYTSTVFLVTILDLRRKYREKLPQNGDAEFPLSFLSLRQSWQELKQHRLSNLNCLDFIRVVAIHWIMLNHFWSEGRVDVLEGAASAGEFKSGIASQWFLGPWFKNSSLGVDIFLVLSGVLTTRSWLLQGARQSLNGNEEQSFLDRTFSFLVRRWLRLFPSFAIFTWLVTTCAIHALLPRFPTPMLGGCGNFSLVSHLLFIYNTEPAPQCLGYLWYMSLDMQLHILSPVLLYWLERRPRGAFAAAALLVVGSATARGVGCWWYDVCEMPDVDLPFIFIPGTNNTSEIYRGIWAIYSRPETRLGGFVVGIMLGYVTFTRQHIQLFTDTSLRSRAIVALATVVSSLFAVASIYGVYPVYMGYTQQGGVYNVLYFASFTTVFSLSVAWYVLLYRYGGLTFVGRWSVWAPLSKLTYGVYLVHMICVFSFNYLPQLQTATGGLQVLYLLPVLSVMAYVASFAFYTFIESPLNRFTAMLSKTMF